MPSWHTIPVATPEEAVEWWGGIRAKTWLLLLPMFQGIPLEIEYRDGVWHEARLFDGGPPLAEGRLSGIPGVPAIDWTPYPEMRRPAGVANGVPGRLVVRGLLVQHRSLRVPGYSKPADFLPLLRAPRMSGELRRLTFIAYGIQYRGRHPRLFAGRSAKLALLRSLNFITPEWPRRPPPARWTATLQTMHKALYTLPSTQHPGVARVLEHTIRRHERSRPAYVIPHPITVDYAGPIALCRHGLYRIARQWSRSLDLDLDGLLLECESYAARRKLRDECHRYVPLNLH